MLNISYLCLFSVPYIIYFIQVEFKQVVQLLMCCILNRQRILYFSDMLIEHVLWRYAKFMIK